MKKLRTILVLILLFPVYLNASSSQCRSGGFTTYSDNFSIYRVKSEKTFYYYDWDGCPVSEDCSSKFNMGFNDKVIVSKLYKDEWACARALNQDKIVTGWIKLNDLKQEVTDFEASVHSWVGTWVEGAVGTLIIDRSGVNLNINGAAIWHGGEHAMNNEGGISGKLTLFNNDQNATVRSGPEDYDCQVDMQLISQDYMVVTDNKKCGGQNVRFDGIYTKEAIK